jgi:ubiquinol-cytochrome c reductase iron-sulfur subunit
VDRSEIVKPAHAATDGAEATVPSLEELSAMTVEETMIAGAKIDGVVLVHRRERFPIPGTKAEKRAERRVAACFIVSFLAAVGFIAFFSVGTFHFHLVGQGSQDYQYFTPVLGILMAITLFGIGIGAVLWAKLIMPEEEAVQDRHENASEAEDILLTRATLLSGFNDTGLPRRSLIKMSLGIAGLGLGLLPLVTLVGAMIKKPRGLNDTLWGKGVPMIYADGRRVGPDDLEPGGVATVFPGVEGGVHAGDSPTLLIRLRPDQKIVARHGHAGFQWGDYVAYSKICTHAGCPASLYEQQTSRLLCPCHQSQFDVLQDAKPVFGPATRSLPKLPLDVEVVDGKNYFIAKGDFPEAIGPGFWERP